MDVVKISLDKLKSSPKKEQYEKVATKTSDTHLFLKRQDWLRISGKLAHGAAGLIKSALGSDPASDEEKSRRLAVCDACEHSSPKQSPVTNRVCGKRLDVLSTKKKTCGCGLSKKASIASEACPLGKW